MNDTNGALRQWSFTEGRRIRGKTVGHPAYPDGREIVTARVKDCIEQDGKRYAVTMSHVFRLAGIPEPGDADLFARICRETRQRKRKSGK